MSTHVMDLRTKVSVVVHYQLTMRLTCGVKAVTPNEKVEFECANHVIESGKRNQKKTICIDSLSVFIYPCSKIGSVSAHLLSMRTPIRTLISKTGICRAYNDYTIEWSDHSRFPSSVRLDSLPTVMLALKGPGLEIDSILVGTERGHIYHLAIPGLFEITRYEVSQHSVRSISRINSTSRNILVGMQDGSVWMAGPKIPNSVFKLFETKRPITSLQVVHDQVYIQSGWSHSTHFLDGAMPRSLKVPSA